MLPTAPGRVNVSACADTNDPGTPSLLTALDYLRRGRRQVRRFLHDLDALAEPFGLVVAGLDPLTGDWLSLDDLQGLAHDQSGLCRLSACHLRIYTAADFLGVGAAGSPTGWGSRSSRAAHLRRALGGRLLRTRRRRRTPASSTWSGPAPSRPSSPANSA
jgi:hypothetical protein